MQVQSASAADLQSQFLTLLVTQLQHQDPIEPIKQENFISQLAQFSTVEGLEQLNVAFQDILHTQEVLGGFDLVGKNVKYVESTTGELKNGHISEAYLDGAALVAVIDDIPVPISQIVGVVADSTSN